MNIVQLETLAKEALPLDQDEWGSDRQIDAQNAFGEAMEQILSPEAFAKWEDYAHKATIEEMVDYGMKLVREGEGSK